MSEKIICGDALEVLKTLESDSVNCIITSPPYFGLRDYGHEDQIGLEDTPEAFTDALVAVFREARRVLRKDGTLWLNLGDSYNSGGSSSPDTMHKEREGFQNHKAKDRSVARWGGGQKKVKGLKPKDLIGIPWRVAFALQTDGWYLRQDIIWAKPNPMPESVTDRCTKSHEYIFLLSKSSTYYFDNEAIKEPSIDKESLKGFNKRGKHQIHESDPEHAATRGFHNIEVGKQYLTRNRRSVWNVTTHPYEGAHFATFPEKLVEPMVMAGCPENGTVLDPFSGAATTGLVAKKLGRNYVGIELNPEYVALSERRLNSIPNSLFTNVATA